MPVALVRIDDRLIHGQVVEGWIPFLDINEVVVVSETVACDATRKTLMRLSLPEDVALKTLTVAETARYLAAPSAGKILVLAAGPAEIAQLLDCGLKFESVNVGGMHYSVGKMQIGRAIFLDEADKNSLRGILAHGTKLEGRGVPTDAAVNIADIINHG